MSSLGLKLNLPTFTEVKKRISEISKELTPGVSLPIIYQICPGQRLNSVAFWVFEGNSKLNFVCHALECKTYKQTFILKCTHRLCKGQYLITVNDSTLISPYESYCEGKRPRKKKLNINSILIIPTFKM